MELLFGFRGSPTGRRIIVFLYLLSLQLLTCMHMHFTCHTTGFCCKANYRLLVEFKKKHYLLNLWAGFGRFDSLLEIILSSDALTVAVLPSGHHTGPSAVSDRSCPSLTHNVFLQALFPAGKPTNNQLLMVQQLNPAGTSWSLMVANSSNLV